MWAPAGNGMSADNAVFTPSIIYTQAVVERHTVVTIGHGLQVRTCIVVDDNRIHEVPICVLSPICICKLIVVKSS